MTDEKIRTARHQEVARTGGGGMNELTKGFGVYSLPIRVVRYTQRNGKTILTLYMGEKINNYLLSTNRSRVFPVLEFMAKSANLMPKIAHDLKLFFARRAYNRSPVSEVDLKRLYNRIAELVGTAQIEETELPD